MPNVILLRLVGLEFSAEVFRIEPGLLPRFKLHVATESCPKPKLGLASSIRGSSCCLLLLTDGANDVSPNQIAEAVAEHQARMLLTWVQSA